MTLREVMTPNVKTIGPSATITDAAKLMKSANVGILPVVEHEKVLGVITDRDLVTRCLADSTPQTAPVRQAMSANPLLLNQNEDLDQALELMSNKGVGRVLVQDTQGHLVGILSATEGAAVCTNQRTVGKLLTSLQAAHKSPKTVAKA